MLPLKNKIVLIISSIESKFWGTKNVLPHLEQMLISIKSNESPFTKTNT